MERWWQVEGWPTAEEWQAVWGFATVLVAAVAAALALRQLRASVRAGAEQARPYVTADIVFRGSASVAIEVKNSGLTAARDIEFQWSDPPLAARDDSQVTIGRGLINDGIPFLAPGRTDLYDLGVYDQLPKGSLVAADGEQVARQWFIGGNPLLREDTPITAIREGRHSAVADAVQSFIGGPAAA